MSATDELAEQTLHELFEAAIVSFLLLYLPTSYGLLEAAIVSFLLIYFSLGYIKTLKISQHVLALVILFIIHIVAWFVSILVAEIVFKLNLTPVLRILGAIILINYFIGLILFIVFPDLIIAWNPESLIAWIKRKIGKSNGD